MFLSFLSIADSRQGLRSVFRRMSAPISEKAAAVSAPSPLSGTLITVGMATLEAEPVLLLLLKNG